MKKWILASFLSVTLFAGNAYGACSQDEAEKKALAFSEAAVAMAQKDAEGYTKLMQELANEMTELQNKLEDMDFVCSFYDKWTAKLK